MESCVKNGLKKVPGGWQAIARVRNGEKILVKKQTVETKEDAKLLREKFKDELRIKAGKEPVLHRIKYSRLPNPDKHLYILSMNGLFKIGVSDHVGARIKSLQTGSPYPITMVYSKYVGKALDVEKILHQKFKTQRVMNEWFRLTKEDVDIIIKIVECYK